MFSFVASSDTTARLWAMTTGDLLRVYQGHPKAPVCCAFHDGAEFSTMKLILVVLVFHVWRYIFIA